MSWAIAMIIFRKFSACFSSWLRVGLAWNFDSLVTPSTSWVTSGPKSSLSSSGVARVSSMVSWRSPVTMLASSSLSSARTPATSRGWTRYGSPECRSCP